jgi:predicted DCC family thiol-disulfide oxidoreductase YuxK
MTGTLTGAVAGRLTPSGPRLRVLFDGQCGLCSKTVHFLFRNEATATFVFTPIQSEAGRILAKSAALDPDDPSSFAVFDERGATRLKSDAAFFALGYCRQPWRSVAVICRYVPQPMCDAVYDFVARRRLSIFGKTDVCALAPEPLRARLETSAESLVQDQAVS